MIAGENLTHNRLEDGQDYKIDRQPAHIELERREESSQDVKDANNKLVMDGRMHPIKAIIESKSDRVISSSTRDQERKLQVQPTMSKESQTNSTQEQNLREIIDKARSNFAENDVNKSIFNELLNDSIDEAGAETGTHEAADDKASMILDSSSPTIYSSSAVSQLAQLQGIDDNSDQVHTVGVSFKAKKPSSGVSLNTVASSISVGDSTNYIVGGFLAGVFGLLLIFIF